MSVYILVNQPEPGNWQCRQGSRAVAVKNPKVGMFSATLVVYEVGGKTIERRRLAIGITKSQTN